MTKESMIFNYLQSCITLFVRMSNVFLSVEAEVKNFCVFLIVCYNFFNQIIYTCKKNQSLSLPSMNLHSECVVGSFSIRYTIQYTIIIDVISPP